MFLVFFFATLYNMFNPNHLVSHYNVLGNFLRCSFCFSISSLKKGCHLLLFYFNVKVFDVLYCVQM